MCVCSSIHSIVSQSVWLYLRFCHFTKMFLFVSVGDKILLKRSLAAVNGQNFLLELQDCYSDNLLWDGFVR